MSNNIVVISKKNCIQCDMTKRRLAANGVEFTLRMIEDDAEALAEVRKLGYSSMPVVIADGTHWAGFQPEKIDTLTAEA